MCIRDRAKTDLVNDPEGVDKRDELRAMDIVCDAMIRYAERYAERLEELADVYKRQEHARADCFHHLLFVVTGTKLRNKMIFLFC